MNQSIQLKFKKLPRTLAELTHSNHFLKLSAFYAYGLCILLIGVVYVLASKPPEVLTLTPDAALYERIAEPVRESAVRRAIEEYLELRYRWEPKTVASRIKDAQAFILPATRKTFESSTANIVRFAQEKLVSQRVFPDKVAVNLEKQIVAIQGDRVTSIQGLKAAGDLKLELSFDYGPRTPKNPWGIYVTKEREG
jgi:hypothetical protein